MVITDNKKKFRLKKIFFCVDSGTKYCLMAIVTSKKIIIFVIRKINYGCIFSCINQIRTTKKCTYVQALFFLLVNPNLPTSIDFTNFNKKILTSINFNSLQPTSAHFDQLQPISHYFNQFLPIIQKRNSTNFN